MKICEEDDNGICRASVCYSHDRCNAKDNNGNPRREVVEFESPSGKRKFLIDDHVIETENNLDNLLEPVSEETRIRVQIEAFCRDINDMMWKLCEMLQVLERMGK